jgi:hypothetical protein
LATPQTFAQLLQVYYNTYIGLNPNTAPSIPGTDPYFKGNAVAQVAANAIQDTQILQNNIFAASSSGVFLDKFAGSLGMTPRMPALPAQGYTTGLTANSGTTAAAAFTIPANTKLTSSTTNQTYIVLQSVSVTISAVLADVVMQVQAVNLGAGTDSPEGDTLTLVTPFDVPTTSQIILSATVATTGMTTGSDIESDNSLALRIFQFMINPRGGGSAGDYIKWCFLGSPNVTQAACITTAAGNSGILYPIIFEGSPDPNFYIDGNANNDYMPTAVPINRTAILADITAVQTYITGVRPVNDNPNVQTVSTYELAATDSVLGTSSNSFTLNVSLSPGVSLTTNILIPSNNTYLTVSQLIQREFRRAIIATVAGGTTIAYSGYVSSSPAITTPNQYILVSDIERTILLGLANSNTFQGNYASVIVAMELEYFYNGSGTATYYVPVPSLQSGNLFQNVGGQYQAYYVYDINTAMVNINVVT